LKLFINPIPFIPFPLARGRGRIISIEGLRPSITLLIAFVSPLPSNFLGLRPSQTPLSYYFKIRRGRSS
jgi:hypothetical protein